ncbi:MAG: PIN domain-containing protein [Verrucomicrobiaceae bacterium]
MKGLDTNVLLRFVTRDDEDQFQRASVYLQSACSSEEPGYITSVVLVELVWSLRSTYKYPREDVCRVLLGILRSRELRVQYADEAHKAAELYLNGEAEGFADAYSGLIALKEGCEETATFDRKAARLDFYEEI